MIGNLKIILNRSYHELSKVQKASYNMPSALLSFPITRFAGRLVHLLLLRQTPCLKIQPLPLYLDWLTLQQKAASNDGCKIYHHNQITATYYRPEVQWSRIALYSELESTFYSFFSGNRDLKDHVNVKPLLLDTYSKLNIILWNYKKTVTFVRLKKELCSKDKKKSQILNLNIFKTLSHCPAALVE